MDILIRVVLMLICSIFIPYMGNLLYSPLSEIKFKELNKTEKIELIPYGLLYIFFLNWFIIVPSILFADCFKYVLNSIT